MPNTAAIRELNDRFRATLIGGRLMMTQGIVGREDADEILRKVQIFDQFGSDNDPHGEHDFGAFEAGSDTIFWKMDYYNVDLSTGSPDPADPSVSPGETRGDITMAGKVYTFCHHL